MLLRFPLCYLENVTETGEMLLRFPLCYLENVIIRSHLWYLKQCQKESLQAETGPKSWIFSLAIAHIFVIFGPWINYKAPPDRPGKNTSRAHVHSSYPPSATSGPQAVLSLTCRRRPGKPLPPPHDTACLWLHPLHPTPSPSASHRRSRSVTFRHCKVGSGSSAVWKANGYNEREYIAFADVVT